jgi:hypothetical protein
MNDFFYIKDDAKLRIQIGEEVKTYTKEEFIKLAEQEGLSISSCGTLFKKDIPGVIPDILTQWYKTRKDNQKKSNELKKENKIEESEYYNRLQYTLKIMLNSAYGAIGAKIFRFYDKDCAESVTISGQEIIKSVIKYFNSLYNKEIGNKEPNDYVICSDTDSVYLTNSDLLKKYNLIEYDECKQFCIKKTKELEIKVNELFNVFCERVFNVKKHCIRMSPEKLCSSGFWTEAKKRYALLKIYDFESQTDVFDKSGKVGKLAITGFDVVRSSFPKKFKEFMGEVLEMIVRQENKEIIDNKILDFEKNINKLKVMDVAKITSVKFLSQKGDRNYNPNNRKPFQIVTGTPFGVKGALYYNDLCDLWELSKENPKIFSGLKVKCLYLKPNEYNIDCIAIKGDGTDPDKIIEFITKYSDHTLMYQQELQGKLKDMYDAMKWSFPNANDERAKEFFDF